MLAGHGFGPLDVATSGAANPPESTRFGFILFILINAVLLVRPGDLLPALDQVPIYETLMAISIFASYRVILAQLTWASLMSRPLTFCVIALLPAIFLSNFSHGNLYDARLGAFAFFKVQLYFLLFVGLIDSPFRFRVLLFVIVVLVTITAVLALLQWYHYIDLEALTPVGQWTEVDEETGELGEMLRLQGPGILGDPNDFALVLVSAMILCAQFLFEQRRWLVKPLLLIPIGLMGYALGLTSSRGGLLSLILGSVVVITCRLPWRRSVPLLLIVLPAFFVIFGGRQTNIDLDDDEDTFQGRVILCRDALVLFHGAPIFGIGYNMMADENGTVAHNSYAHTYAELGLFGGTLFVGMIYLAVMAVYQLKPKTIRFKDDELRRWRSCVFAIVAAYALGIWSLSRPYAIPTYLVIAIVATYCNLATTRPSPVLRGVNQSFFIRLGKAGIVCLIVLHVYVRLMLA